MPDVHPDTGQPVGFRVDLLSARQPDAVTLTGRYGSIERLDSSKHRASLWQAVGGHDRIWTYMAYGPFADEGAFSGWLESRVALTDPYYYAIVEPSGRAVGLAALMSIRPDMRVVESSGTDADPSRGI